MLLRHVVFSLVFFLFQLSFASQDRNCNSALQANSVLAAINFYGLEPFSLTLLEDRDFSTALEQLENDYRSHFLEKLEYSNEFTFEQTLLPFFEIKSKLNLLSHYLERKQFEFPSKNYHELIAQVERQRRHMIADTLSHRLFRQKVESFSKFELNVVEQSLHSDIVEQIEQYDARLSKNPLLRPSNLDFNTVPFDQIRIQHFYPALVEAFRVAEQRWHLLLNEPQSPSYANTIISLAAVDETLERVETVLYLYNSNNNLQEIKSEINQLVRSVGAWRIDFSSAIFTNKDYFQRVKRVAETETLNAFQKRHIDKLLRGFIHSGMDLEPVQLARFLELKKKLTELTTEFTNNTMEQGRLTHFHVHITDPSQLEGVEESVILRAKKNAESLGLEGWAFDSEIDTLYAILDFAESEELRKRYWLTRVSRNTHGDDLDNTELVKAIVKTRHEIAQILGYQNHAELTLTERMAKTPERVAQFLDDLLERVKPKAEQEMQILHNYKAAKAKDKSPLKPWEVSYWMRRYKEENYKFDKQKLKLYFEVHKVLAGVFKTAHRLYGLHFLERKDLPVYDSTVQVFEVREGDKKLGLLYIDLYSRSGVKSEGAWMSAWFSQDRNLQGERIPPVVSINANFTQAEQNLTYLNAEEVLTVFHEFGHALHALMSDVEISAHASPSVQWDFVELPSQFMENYVYEREVLDSFASNDENQPLPGDLWQAWIDSESFGSAWIFMMQLKSAYLDMAYFSKGHEGIEDLLTFEQEINEKTRVLELSGYERPFAPTFSHIMVGGYSAGYYSYKWAEVLDADAYAAFKETGDIFNPELANRFAVLLSMGGSMDPEDLYFYFRGQEPSVDHLLKRSKIIE